MNVIFNEDFDFEIEEDSDKDESIDIDNSQDADYTPESEEDEDETIPEVEIADENDENEEEFDPDDLIDPKELRAVYVLKNDKYVLKDLIKEKEKRKEKNNKTPSEKKQSQKEIFNFILNRVNQPNNFEFRENVGSKTSASKPITIFRKFFDETLVNYIVDRSNEYAARPEKTIIPRPYRRKNTHELNKSVMNDVKKVQMKKLTSVEFLRFLGIIILMSISKKNKIHDYWNKNNIIDTPIFKKYFQISRFLKILSMKNI